MIPLILLILIAQTMTDIVDYTREDYVLLEDGDVALYNDYGENFHLTNLTNFTELVNSDKSYNIKKYRYNNLQGNNEDVVAYINDLDTELEIELIETLLDQTQKKDTRYKRGINELGTLWKWIAKTPDHDGLVLINNKLNELIKNNNKQYTTNSEIFKIISQLTKTIKNVNENSHVRLLTKRKYQFLVTEPQNMVRTIAMAKIGILNPAILHLDEIRNEHGGLTITDLMAISN